MSTEKTPTIYGTVTFEQFCEALETVRKYLDGLANTYAIKNLLTEEHRNKLEPDLIMGGMSMMRVNAAHRRLTHALEGLQAEILEKSAAKERAAQAEPGNTYGPKTENL